MWNQAVVDAGQFQKGAAALGLASEAAATAWTAIANRDADGQPIADGAAGAGAGTLASLEAVCNW